MGSAAGWSVLRALFWEAWKFGLFATNNCVQPEEKEDYENFSTALWTTLAPADPVEEVTAAEFVRNAWRLRRCAMAEETLGEIVARWCYCGRILLFLLGFSDRWRLWRFRDWL